MKRHAVLAGAVCMGAVCLVSAGRAAEELKGGIPGVLMSNGTFRPFPPPAANAPAAATTSRVGVIKVTATIQLVSTAAELTPSSIKCALTVSVFDTDGTNTNQIQEEDRNPATVTGSTAKCAMSVPFYWNLYNPGIDTVNLNLAVTGFDANGKGRSAYLTVPPIPVPANNTAVSLLITTRL